MKVYRVLLAILFAWMLGSCRPFPSEAEGDQDMAPSQPNEIPSEGIPSTDETETHPSLPIPAIRGMQTAIEKAKEDLAQRLSISPSEINTIETKEVFWPDSSLGCPQSGITYTRVTISGYMIILESSGSQFEYHANIHNYVFYCENPTPPILETPSNGHP